MIGFEQIVLLSTRGLLIGLFVLLVILALTKKPLKNYVKYSLSVGLATVLVSNALSILLFYVNLKKSVFGKMLIGGPGSFFFEQSALAVKDLLLILAIGLVVFLITNRIVKYQKKPFLEEELPAILFLSIIATNYTEVVIILVIGAFLALVFAVAKSIRAKKINEERFGLVPFIAISAAAVLILGMLPFYYDILTKFHII